ncbi:MAG: hypothetical protein VW498_02005 [Candidatus Thalassarchaeaceae archaeon]
MAEITIADATPRVQYTVTTSTTGPWTIPWPYYNESDIKVYFDDALKTITTDYTISGTAVDDGFSGGSVTAVSAQSNITVTIVRDIPIARTTDFPVGPFNVATLNKDLDKLYAICQQLEETQNRILQLAETTSTAFSAILPDIDGSGGQYLKINSGETAIEYGTGTTVAYQGSWSSSSTYAQNDIVENDGSSYISLVDSNLNNTPPAPASAPDAFWDLIASKGDAGAAGTMTGPGSSTDNSITRFDGTSGGSVQNSGVTIDDNDNMYGHGSASNAQSGTTYTLTASDNGKIVTLSNASAITLTLPETSTETLAVGFSCMIIQRGAGQVTVVVEGSDTLESSGSKTKLTGQHSSAFVTKITAGSPNTWGLYGDIAT